MLLASRKHNIVGVFYVVNELNLLDHGIMFSCEWFTLFRRIL